MAHEFKTVDPAQRLCRKDNWDSVLDDGSPRAVRWASSTTQSAFNDPTWGKWHYTEGNGGFTACGKPVVPFVVDGSPQEAGLEKITCRKCSAAIRLRGQHLVEGEKV
jgi:hypothetical protein